MIWWDSHCHHQAPSAGSNVLGGLIVTTQPDEWHIVLESPFDSFWHYAIGLHPWFSDAMVDWSLFESLLVKYSNVAIGEVGLDGCLGHPNMQTQIAIFERQCLLSVKYDRVMSLHFVRDKGAGLSMIKRLHVTRAIVHGFVGSLEQATSYQRLGLYLGLGPRVFHEMSERRMLMLKSLDRALVLLESDSPSSFASNPSVVVDVGFQLARIWDISVEEVATICDQNWRNLWRV